MGTPRILLSQCQQPDVDKLIEGFDPGARYRTVIVQVVIARLDHLSPVDSLHRKRRQKLRAQIGARLNAGQRELETAQTRTQGATLASHLVRIHFGEEGRSLEHARDHAV
ncbi:MAG: hypothetical protein ACRDSZ_13980 [Pseudonocardiaceae bacterium]